MCTSKTPQRVSRGEAVPGDDRLYGAVVSTGKPGPPRHPLQHPQRIDTRWTLSWVAPAPWKPAMSIPGRSELGINDEGKIVSHIDYWDLLETGSTRATVRAGQWQTCWWIT